MSAEKLQKARGSRLKRGVLSTLWGAAAAVTLAVAAYAGVETIKTYATLEDLSDRAIAAAVSQCTADPNERPEYQEMCFNFVANGEALTPTLGWPTLAFTTGIFGFMFAGQARYNAREARSSNTTVRRLLSEQTP